MTYTFENINAIIENQRRFFTSGATKSLSFRIEQLKRLKQAIKDNEENIYKALWLDLHKSKEESYLTEVSIVLQEIDSHIQNLKKWMKPQRVPTPLHLLPSSSTKIYEPLGVALIIAPWNYPFQLLFNPLIGAISAGNCVVLKPSPYAANISQLMEKIISKTFNQEYIKLVSGGRGVNKVLLDTKFDIIFFTGSPALGKVVMEAASKHLTPVILELGGKSPVIVDKSANLKIAAKRIIWGKTINAGQTCIAPDYLLVDHSVKQELIENIKNEIKELFGDDIKASKYYGRIINDNAFNRLISYLEDGDVIIGGISDKSERYISPTIIDNVNFKGNIMKDEIFGPILPIITFKDIDEAISHINLNEKPLALYYFGKKETAKRVIEGCSSGGGCINDTIMHIANHNLPFGGVGNSGMGRYHGKNSFKSFSNQRSIMSSNTKIDMPFRYPPFKLFKWIKRIV